MVEGAKESGGRGVKEVEGCEKVVACSRRCRIDIKIMLFHGVRWVKGAKANG